MRIATFLLVSLACIACKDFEQRATGEANRPRNAVSQPETLRGHAGVFRLSKLATPAADDDKYLAEAPLGDFGCDFEIHISKAREHGSARVFQFTNGRIVARSEQASCVRFLSSLATHLALDKDTAIPKPAPVDSLPVAFAIMGEADSRVPEDLSVEGSFAPKPAGSWIVTKMFLADGEGEVYLNLNPQRGVGEFSLKDEGYAEIVVTELAKVLHQQ